MDRVFAARFGGEFPIDELALILARSPPSRNAGFAQQRADFAGVDAERSPLDALPGSA